MGWFGGRVGGEKVGVVFDDVIGQSLVIFSLTKWLQFSERFGFGLRFEGKGGGWRGNGEQLGVGLVLNILRSIFGVVC